MKTPFALAIALTLSILHVSGGISAPVTFTVAAFEKSSLFKKYTLQEKDSWGLKVGGTNYSYRFVNPGMPGESMGVEMGPKAADIRRISMSWPGNYPENRLDAHEATLIREILALFDSSVKASKIVEYVRSSATVQYPGGGNTMPRKKFGNLNVYAGQSQWLIVGFEKTK